MPALRTHPLDIYKKICYNLKKRLFWLALSNLARSPFLYSRRTKTRAINLTITTAPYSSVSHYFFGLPAQIFRDLTF
jgi:hypothetical protein